jgi:5-methylcytosine-specific restriction endonuclease McrA
MHSYERKQVSRILCKNLCLNRKEKKLSTVNFQSHTNRQMALQGDYKTYIGLPCHKCLGVIRSTSGRQFIECRNECSKRWGRDHPNATKERMRRWRNSLENREKEKKSRREKWVYNSTSAIASAKRWREKNPEKVADIQRATNAKRRSRELNAEGSYTVNEWIELKQLYENKCLCCGIHEIELVNRTNKAEKKLIPDHIIPLVKSGTNYITNIQPLCLRCNSSKHKKIIDYRGKHIWPQ